jgi:hypothetical protein
MNALTRVSAEEMISTLTLPNAFTTSATVSTISSTLSAFACSANLVVTLLIATSSKFLQT